MVFLNSQQAVLICRLFSLAMELHQNIEVVKAEKQYDSVLQMASNHTDANRLLGGSPQNHGRSYVVIEFNKMTVSIVPVTGTCPKNLGAAYLGIQEPWAVRSIFERAIQIRPNYADTHENPGLIFMELEEFQGAKMIFRKALGLASQHLDANSNYPPYHLTFHHSI